MKESQRSNMDLLDVDLGKIVVKVPVVMEQCWRYLKARDMLEGVFRISGSTRRVNACYNGRSLASWLAENPSQHDVCSVIKRCLRQYLDGEPLFNEAATGKIKLLYDQYTAKLAVRHDFLFEDSGLVFSFKTAKTSYDSDPLEEFNEALVQYLAHDKETHRMYMFLYLLHNLSFLLQHAASTRMSSWNLAIIFEPYVFSSSKVEHLPYLQRILQIFIQNGDVIADIYASVGSLQSDDNSYLSVESPLTNNVANESFAEEPDIKDHSNRRSLSKRISTLFDGYYNPVGGSTSKKRLSLSFDLLAKSKFSEKASSSEDFTHALTPDDTKAIPRTSFLGHIPSPDPYTASPYVAQSGNSSAKNSTDNFSRPRKQPHLHHDTFTGSNKRQNRKSFINNLKGLSLHEKPEQSKAQIYNQLNNSTDGIFAPSDPMINNAQKSFLKRSLSLKVRSRKY